MKLMLVLVFLISLLSTKNLVEGSCVWYGQCGYNDDGQPLNCLDNGRARLYNDSNLIEEFEEYCPNLSDENGDYYLCCDTKQINSMIDSLQIARHLLARCPSCWLNFREYFCQLTCSPNQSNFIYVKKTRKSTTNKPNRNQQVVLEIEYMVSESFAYDLFDSCVNVTNPFMGNNALDLLCGRWGSGRCSPERLLSSLGDVKNGFSPFLVDVSLWENEVIYKYWRSYRPMNSTAIPCYEGFDGHKPCSCSDCEGSCTD